jgi:uncharacterized phage-like protein YoqJ
MARGFDIPCGETVMRLRDGEYKDIKLVCVIPYLEHWQRWGEKWRMRHANLEANADKVIYMGEKCNKGIYYGRNRIMVDNSNRLICYWDGERGGEQGIQ